MPNTLAGETVSMPAALVVCVAGGGIGDTSDDVGARVPLAPLPLPLPVPPVPAATELDVAFRSTKLPGMRDGAGTAGADQVDEG